MARCPHRPSSQAHSTEPVLVRAPQHRDLVVPAWRLRLMIHSHALSLPDTVPRRYPLPGVARPVIRQEATVAVIQPQLSRSAIGR